MDIDTASTLTCLCGSGLPPDRCCDQNQAKIVPVREASEEVMAQLQEAIALFNEGQREEMVERCLSLLREQPGLVPALQVLAEIRKIQRVFKAELALRRRIFALAPGNLAQMVRYATALIEHGDMDEGVNVARRAVWLGPKDVRAHWMMALAFAQVGRIAEADYHFDFAKEHTSNLNPELLLSYAEHLRTHGRIDKARGLIAEAEALGQETPRSVIDAARTEIMAGNYDVAEPLLERVMRDWPRTLHSAPVHMARALIAAQRKNPAQALEIIDSYAGRGPMTEPMRLLRGRVLDDLGRVDEAFAEFDAGKAMELKAARRVHNPGALEARVAAIRSMMTPMMLDTLPKATVREDSPQPLFITGFARSGTTVLEQSLTMHERITAGGELHATGEVTIKVSSLLGSQLRYPEALAEMLVADRRHSIGQLRDDYLGLAMPYLVPKPGAKWFTDKALNCEPATPLRHLMFPHSPIINIVRHPLDSVLSVFSHQFSETGGYSASLETAARLYRANAEAAEQWRLTLPQIKYMRVRHEDILADQEGEMRRIFDFIGEAFDPACLAFHKNDRVAPTLSVAQVREKINDKRKYRYKRYLKHLEPVIPILEPVIAMLGYTIETA